MSIMDEFERKMERGKEALQRNRDIGEGVLVGKTFRSQVGDGYAYYEVTAVDAKTVDVKWRDYHPDDWQDQVLGLGGRFPRDSIERLVKWEDGIAAVFGREDQ